LASLFKQKFTGTYVLDEEVFSSYLSDINGAEVFALAYEYGQKLNALPQKVLNSQHLGFIGAALFDDALFDVPNSLGLLYSTQRSKALYLCFKQDLKMSRLLEKFSIRDFDQFMILFFPAPLDEENLFVNTMVDTYDWTRFDNIATAFDDNRPFTLDQNDVFKHL
jgi:hypothetical protein